MGLEKNKEACMLLAVVALHYQVALIKSGRKVFPFFFFISFLFSNLCAFSFPDGYIRIDEFKKWKLCYI